MEKQDLTDAVAEAEVRIAARMQRARELLEAERQAPLGLATEMVTALKAEADQQVGALHQRMNDCGPRGNRMVETQWDVADGRSAALADVLAILHAIASR